MHKPFSFTLSIYIACFLLAGCSKLGNRYGVIENIDQEHRNNIENLNENIENPEASLSDSTQRLFAAIKDSNLAEVKSLLNNHFNGEAFMDLCETNVYGNTCLHVAAGAENLENPQEAEKIIALLLHRMKPLLLNKEAFKDAVDETDKFDKINSGIRINERELRKKYSTFFDINYSSMNKDNFWMLGIFFGESERDKLRNLVKNIQPQRYNSDSELIRKNKKQETPIYAAIKYGSSGVMDTLLTYTHRFIGLDLAVQTGRPLSDIFEGLIDLENTDKLKKLVAHYYQRSEYESIYGTWNMIHENDTYFPTNKCIACEENAKIAKEIKNKQNNKPQWALVQDQKLNEEEHRIRTVLRTVGIDESKVDLFFASIMRSPASNAVSAYAASISHSSSDSRLHGNT